MFNRITSFFTHIVNKYLPDPLVFAIILTLIVLVLSMLLQHSVVKVIEVWGDGFFNLLAFSMQMCLVVEHLKQLNESAKSFLVHLHHHKKEI